MKKKKRKKLLFSLPFPASQVALMLKNSPANAGEVRNCVVSLGQKIPWRRAMATHISILAWRTP